ncbi:U3 small nucleolar RNA-interacting protein 2-like isoform X1 [Varroa jacobsoni]|uniref:U3 small nucleolar RNA-interacting protein 2-like isoform X1 n=1 Tax=Varroa jacobsoni TaxID=62625 RepID=UPI000BF3AD39|nr:U3 small nucleolar RNA-interacting protein 2-like isoform X1 [Varroa jacobsoni]XP_022706053.1 U3 small nucleolar RNA-interacting protein 2-like isoform X1 [Varroa jacobsoni]
MSFFIKANRGRKRNDKHGKSGTRSRKFAALPPPVKKSKRDLEISSDEDEIEDDSYGTLRLGEAEGNASDSTKSDSDAEVEETAEQKKLRLAKAYLDEERRKQAENDVDEELKHNLIAHRLKRDLLGQAGRLFKPLARSIQTVQKDAIVRLKNQHRLPITRAVIGPDEKVLFSASKDGTLVRCCLFDVGGSTSFTRSVDTESCQGRRTIRVKNAHDAAVLALALSSDGRFLASGCAKNVLTIWNPDSLEKMHTFGTAQHRGKITGLAFRYGTHQLFSCSADRTVKLWNLDEMAYVETLFGHEDTVTSVDSFIKDRALTSGGRDGTLRLWKIPEESQLVFQGNQSSADCCAMVNDDTFVSGHDDGKVYLWKVMKKKPVASVTVSAPGEWITALSAVRSSDFVAAGSSCGYIALLMVVNSERGSEGKPALEEVQRIQCIGFVNSLVFSASSRLLIAAVSQEHALGRWQRIKEAKNAVQVFPLKYDTNYNQDKKAVLDKAALSDVRELIS